MNIRLAPIGSPSAPAVRMRAAKAICVGAHHPLQLGDAAAEKRRQAEAAGAVRKSPEERNITYANGSVEWQAEQDRLAAMEAAAQVV